MNAEEYVAITNLQIFYCPEKKFYRSPAELVDWSAQRF
jgi:hypothetical protein